MTDDLLAVTRVFRTGLPPDALVVGDPARAADVAAPLAGAEEISYHREYRVFSGSCKGLPVTVASHGVGAPGAILLFQELADAGVRTLLRFGTAGAVVDGRVLMRDRALTTLGEAAALKALSDLDVRSGLHARPGLEALA